MTGQKRWWRYTRPSWPYPDSQQVVEQLALAEAYPSRPSDPPHWACPDCGHPCYCIGPGQALAHVRCGLLELVDGATIADLMRAPR